MPNTVVLLVGYGALLILLIIATFCAIVLFLALRRDLASKLNTSEGSPFLAGTHSVARGLHRYYSWFVGDTWWDWRTTTRLIALYWWLGATGATGFLLHGTEIVQHSGWRPIALNIWLWANIVTDYVSYNVTRECLSRYRAMRTTMIRTVGRLVLIDFTVALLMLVLVILATNTAYVCYKYEDLGMILEHAPATIFSLETTFDSYNLVSEGMTLLTLPAGAFWVAATTYFPTLLWVIGILLILVLTFLTRFLKSITHLSDKLVWVIACFAGFIASVVGIVASVALIHTATGIQ